MFAPDGRSRIDRQMLTATADELDKTIRKLSAMVYAPPLPAVREPPGMPYLTS